MNAFNLIHGLRELARVLGCAEHQAEAVAQDETSARHALGRRGFFQAVGAVAAGVVMPLPGNLILPGSPEDLELRAHREMRAWLDVMAEKTHGWMAYDSSPIVIAYGNIAFPVDSFTRPKARRFMR